MLNATEGFLLYALGEILGVSRPKVKALLDWALGSMGKNGHRRRGYYRDETASYRQPSYRLGLLLLSLLNNSIDRISLRTK
ncbi:hypothetical protein V8J82_14195 [Gymnodinialimonas sp. 2305UL16-5]|uniref:hypothetical protein n=1 Tax=Gymnodinialimonas mytili TaxID=3126503 RepID=UPI003097AF60